MQIESSSYTVNYTAMRPGELQPSSTAAAPCSGNTGWGPEPRYQPRPQHVRGMETGLSLSFLFFFFWKPQRLSYRDGPEDFPALGAVPGCADALFSSLIQRGGNVSFNPHLPSFSRALAPPPRPTAHPTPVLSVSLFLHFLTVHGGVTCPRIPSLRAFFLLLVLPQFPRPLSPQSLSVFALREAAQLLVLAGRGWLHAHLHTPGWTNQEARAQLRDERCKI